MTRTTKYALVLAMVLFAGPALGQGSAASLGSDRFGAIVTCGPAFNGALCWPSAQHYKPAPVWE